MRIAFFIDDYLPSVHGVATSTATFRAALERMGHEVYVVAPKAEGYEETDDHVIRLSSSRYYVFDSREVATIYPGLARRFDAYDFDIVHSQTQFSLGVLAHWVAKRQNIPHVTTIHTLYTELIDDYPLAVLSGLLALSVAFPVALKSQPVLPRVHRETIKHLNKRDMKTALSRQGWRLTAAFANKCDACLSPSQHLARILIDDGGLTTPCMVLPNGLDSTRYRSARAADSPIPKAPGEKIIICVARLSPEKRQMTLVEAMPHLSGLPVKLVLVGPGPSQEELGRRAGGGRRPAQAGRRLLLGLLPLRQPAHGVPGGRRLRAADRLLRRADDRVPHRAQRDSHRRHRGGGLRPGLRLPAVRRRPARRAVRRGPGSGSAVRLPDDDQAAHQPLRGPPDLSWLKAGGPRGAPGCSHSSHSGRRLAGTCGACR